MSEDEIYHRTHPKHCCGCYSQFREGNGDDFFCYHFVSNYKSGADIALGDYILLGRNDSPPNSNWKPVVGLLEKSCLTEHLKLAPKPRQTIGIHTDNGLGTYHRQFIVFRY